MNPFSAAQLPSPLPHTPPRRLNSKAPPQLPSLRPSSSRPKGNTPLHCQSRLGTKLSVPLLYGRAASFRPPLRRILRLLILAMLLSSARTANPASATPAEQADQDDIPLFELSDELPSNLGPARDPVPPPFRPIIAPRARTQSSGSTDLGDLRHPDHPITSIEGKQYIFPRPNRCGFRCSKNRTKSL